MLEAVTLDQMRVFVAVAETGSFRASAKRLARVQSAISHAIGNLEAQLGVRLFDRTGRRPVLTREGDSLLADARAILLKVEAMRARARGLGEGVELALPVVVDTLFDLGLMSAALDEIRRAYPGVVVQVSVLPLGGPPSALLARRAAIGVIVGDTFRDPAIEMEAIGTVRIVAVAAAQHPLALQVRTTPSLRAADFADHLQIVLTDPTPLSEGRNFAVLSPGIWRVNTQEAKYALIRAGLGWGTLPEWQVARDLVEGGLVCLPALGTGGVSTANIYLAHRIDVAMGPVARALRAALLARHAAPGARPRKERAGAKPRAKRR